MQSFNIELSGSDYAVLGMAIRYILSSDILYEYSQTNAQYKLNRNLAKNLQTKLKKKNNSLNKEDLRMLVISITAFDDFLHHASSELPPSTIATCTKLLSELKPKISKFEAFLI